MGLFGREEAAGIRFTMTGIADRQNIRKRLTQ